MTLNRFCSSGLNAVADLAKSIMVGEVDICVAGGVESMSLVPMGGHKPSANPELLEKMPTAYTPMGITAENVAKRFNVSRADQDAFAEIRVAQKPMNRNPPRDHQSQCQRQSDQRNAAAQHQTGIEIEAQRESNPRETECLDQPQDQLASIVHDHEIV
jgi:hypothetical protein